jgi:Zn-finger in Ran binding protein and others
MKPYDPTLRQRSPKRSLEEHQEHGETETMETSPRKKVKTNGIIFATHVQATSGSGAAAEDAIVIDDLDEDMNDGSAPAPAPNVPVPIPAPAPAQISSMPPPPNKPRAMPALPPAHPLAPPYVRAFSPSRPSPLRMVSSVDSPEGSPNPTPFPNFSAKPKPEPEVIDIDAEEDQLAEDDNEKTPTPVPAPIVVARPVPAPVFKPTPALASIPQPKLKPIVNLWSIPAPKVTQPVSPTSPKTTARNALVDSLVDYSKGLSGIPLCYDVVMDGPEAQTIARTAAQGELPTFEIDLSPMFDPTPWIERRNKVAPAPVAQASTQAAPLKQAVATFDWAAAGLKPAGPVAGEWTCKLCGLKSKDTATKCSVCEAPKPNGAATSALATPTPPPALAASPAPIKPTPFNWAAAGLRPSTPVAGEWTCNVCNCKTKDTLSKCSVCEAPKPGAAVPASTPAPAPTSPTMPALIPAPAPVKAAPVAFNFAAAKFELPTKATGTWTCSMCMIDNKPAANKCIACDTLRPNSIPVPAPLTNGFKLPPPIRNNGFTWGIPPSSIVASEPAINGN